MHEYLAFISSSIEMQSPPDCFVKFNKLSVIPLIAETIMPRLVEVSSFLDSLTISITRLKQLASLRLVPPNLYTFHLFFDVSINFSKSNW